MLAALWLGPLPALASRSFTAHMVLHMGVVALVAPVLAWGVAGGRLDPVLRAPRWFAPLPLSLLEMLVVWGWHAPGPHQAARGAAGVMALEQTSFLACGLLLWLSVLGGTRARRRECAGAATIGLLLTSMHMTLLGALLGLSQRALYLHSAAPPGGLSPLEDQQLGGAVMLLVGGAVYLAGGLAQVATLIRAAPRERRAS